MNNSLVNKNSSASLPECQKLETTLDYAKCYQKLGFTVIPLKPRDKVPIAEWKQYQDPNHKPTDADLERWFKYTDNNIGIICGRASGNLVAMDFDDPILFTKFLNGLESQAPELFEKIQNTLQNATKDGFHLLLRIDMDPNEFARLFPSSRDLLPHFDIRAEGGYIVAPPSVHPEKDEKGNTIRYHFVPNDEVLTTKRPVVITYDEWQTIMKILGIPPEKYPGVSRLNQEAQTDKPVAEKQVNKDCRDLPDSIIETIVDKLKRYYVKGHRNAINMTMLGAFLKANICRDTAWKFTELITRLTNDEERNARLYNVDYHYKVRAINPGVQNLKGLSGLREEIEKILTERNVSPDTTTQEASKVVAEISSLLGLRKAPGVAWLKGIVNGEITEWIAQGKTGIYVYKIKGDSVEYILVAPLRIKKVVELKVVGLDIKNLYKVVLDDGVELWGTLSEIMSSLKAQYPINPNYAYALQRLIEYMAEETEEVYYSPGVWVVDSKIVFVKEPGYLPPWKKYIRWEINTEDPGEEAIKEALLKIKRFVESYRDPSKPSIVLSYAVIAPIAPYIKQTLNIFPHMIIHGLEGTGKSVLLDFIKLLLGITWSEELPNSEYQAHRVLTPATLPAIIDEIGTLVEGYRKDNANSVKAVEVIHRSATQEVMRVLGGSEYAGYYLAVRSIIATTNTDISFMPWQVDKFVIVKISLDEAIDISKAKGVTPRTMDSETKKNIQYIGYMLLKGLEGKLGEIEKLKTLQRDELKERLLDIGYSLWVELYKRYGLEPFPAPGKGESAVAKVTLKDQYKDIALSYIKRAIKNGEIDRFLINQHDIENDQGALESLEIKHAILLVDNTNGNDDEWIVMKTAYLTKIAQQISKDYGLPALGWQRLAELLEAKQTRRKIGGEIVNNLYMLKIS